MRAHRDAALAAIATVAASHSHGHTCADGTWYNPNAGQRIACPIAQRLDTATAEVEAMHAAVHEAAHDTATAEAVAEGMTGLVMADLEPEDREGWTRTARMAVEALAEQLDRDPQAEARAARAAAVQARLTLGPGDTAAPLVDSDPRFSDSTGAER